MAAVTNVLALPPGNTFETALGKMLSLGKLPDLGLTWLYRFFSPANLFANGEQGAWYDPSDLSTLFQDAAGTTPVTALEQPVGLMLDKSKGLVLGPELVVNGGFDTDTTWTKETGWSIADGKANFTTGGFAAMLTQANVFEVGKCYRVSFDVSNLSSGGVNVYSGATISIPAVNISAQTNGTFTGFILATSTALGIRSSFLGNYSIDNISVRELPGNHASQSTATSRPVLSARVNLLTKTEQFDDAAWVKEQISVNANLITAPDGSLTADKLVENTTNSSHRVYQQYSASAVAYTYTVYLKAAERTWAVVYFPATSSTETYFNLSDGVIGSVGLAVSAATIESIGNGWYKCSITHTKVASGNFFPGVQVTTGNNVLSYLGDGTSGIYIWGADLRVANDGVNLPSYQRVNTATDYDSVGFPAFLRCDGIDDGMVTGTITPGTDKAQVFAGVRKLSDTAGGMLAEFGNFGISTVGAWRLFAPVGTSDYSFASRGTVTSAATYTNSAVAAPITNVLTGIGDISGDRVTLRIDGTQVVQSTADQGTGNFLAYPLYLFRRGGTTLPFNGNFYGCIIRFGDNLPIETIEQTEAWMAAKTGVTL